MLTLAFATLGYVAFSVATALAPRASASPIVYYRPARQCPSSTTNVAGASLRNQLSYTQESYISCNYEKVGCSYNKNSGALMTNGAPCVATAPVNSGCSYECPMGTSSPSFSVQQATASTDGTPLKCTYRSFTVPGLVTCQYSPTGEVLRDQSSADCLGPIVLDCGATLTNRRQYRSKNDYTAWLERRAQRRAAMGAVPT